MLRKKEINQGINKNNSEVATAAEEEEAESGDENDSFDHVEYLEYDVVYDFQLKVVAFPPKD